MQIVNHRYRVVEVLEQNRVYSVYECTDIMRSFLKVKLYILNSNYVAQEFINYCISKLECVDIINNEYSVEVLDFGIVSNIDNKKVIQKNYFYTTKFISNKYKIINRIDGADEEKLIEYFIDICRIAKKNFMANNENMIVNIGDIYLDENQQILINDIISWKLLIESEYFIDEDEKYFLNIINYYEGRKDDGYYQLFSLGITLLKLVVKSKNLNIHIENFIESVIYGNNYTCEKYKESIGEKIYLIIYNCIIQREKSLYKKLEDVIFNVNKLYDKQYEIYINKQNKKLNFNTPIVGREEEISLLLGVKEFIFKSDDVKNIVTIHGEVGIGKTRLLKHIDYILRLNRDFVQSCIEVTGDVNSTVSVILRQIITNVDKDLIQKYKTELTYFIPELNKDSQLQDNNKKITDNKEKYIIISKICSFIREAYSNKQGVMVIDNIDRCDGFTIDLLQYLTSKISRDNKLMIILSYRDGECLNNKKFMDFISNVQEFVKIDMILKPLNKEKVIFMIKDIFNISKITNKFVDQLYVNTMGNPLFLEETLKDLLVRNYIYIDKKTGEWHLELKNNVCMPKNMDEVCNNQVEKLDSISIKILEVVSIFYTAVSVELIKNIIPDINNVYIENKISSLISRGILCNKISDNGFVFDFYNKFLKSYIYNSMEDSKKKEMHNLAASILCENYKENENLFIEEIIHHLEKAENNKELVYYYFNNAKRLMGLKNIDEAIKYNIKVLDIVNSFDKKGEFANLIVDILMNLGELYSSNNLKNKSLLYYIKGKETCKVIKLKEKEIDFTFRIINLFYEQGNQDKYTHYMKEVEELINNTNYIEGIIQYKIKQCNSLLDLQEYEQVKTISSEGLELAKGKYEYFETELKTIYCTALLFQDKVNDVLSIYMELLEKRKNSSDTIGLNKIYNDLGVIYSDYIQDFDEALVWFNKTYELSKKENNGFYEIISLCNMGFIYYTNLDRSNSYKYFKESIEKCYEYESLSLLFYSYSYLGQIMCIMGNYEEAYNYYLLCEQQIKKAPNQGKNIGDYYLFLWQFNKDIGEYEKAYYYLDQAYSVYEDMDCIIRWNIEALILLRKHELAGDDNIDIVPNLSKILSKILNVNFRVRLTCEGILNLIERNYISEAKELFLDIKKLPNYDLCIFNIPILKYIEYKLSNKKDKESLDIVLEYCKKEDQSKILWVINLEIGNYYYENKQYSDATIYFFEACAIIMDIVSQVPKEYKVNFFKTNKLLLEPFKKFNEAKSYFNKETININSISIESLEDINILFNNLNKESILNNKFIASLKEFSSGGLKDVDTFEDLIGKLNNVDSMNLQLITQYLCYITLASRVMIIEEKNNHLYVISSSNKFKDLPNDISIINQCRNKVKTIIYNDSSSDNYNIKGYKLSRKTIKAAMCIPVILENERNIQKQGRRNADYIYSDNVLGYIYIESDRILHNINEYSQNKCLSISKILGIILDKHKIKINSTMDKLTGTFTRKYLEKCIQAEIDRSSELNGEFSIVMFDIDKFKDINDTFGHRTGDKVLKEMCEVVLNNIRQSDVIGRYGGEEFIIILPDTELKEAEAVAEKLRYKIETKKLLGDKRPVTVSLGIANYPNHSTIYEELIEKVDQALYEAKNSGRNNVKVWNEKYKLKGNTTNKLSGILVGTGNQDYKNVSTIVEFIDALNDDLNFKEKIYYMLSRIIEIMECDDAGIFIINDNIIIDKFTLNKERLNEVNIYNLDKIEKVISTGENICIIDWDNILDQDIITDIPDWKSIIVSPLKFKEKIVAVLYLSVSVQKKEFNFDELNFANTLGKFILNLLKSDYLRN